LTTASRRRRVPLALTARVAIRARAIARCRFELFGISMRYISAIGTRRFPDRRSLAEQSRFGVKREPVVTYASRGVACFSRSSRAGDRTLPLARGRRISSSSLFGEKRCVRGVRWFLQRHFRPGSLLSVLSGEGDVPKRRKLCRSPRASFNRGVWAAVRACSDARSGFDRRTTISFFSLRRVDHDG